MVAELDRSAEIISWITAMHVTMVTWCMYLLHVQLHILNRSVYKWHLYDVGAMTISKWGTFRSNTFLKLLQCQWLFWTSYYGKFENFSTEWANWTSIQSGLATIVTSVPSSSVIQIYHMLFLKNITYTPVLHCVIASCDASFLWSVQKKIYFFSFFRF